MAETPSAHSSEAKENGAPQLRERPRSRNRRQGEDAIHFTADGRPDVYEKIEGQGRKITHVFWAIGEGPKGRQHH